MPLINGQYTSISSIPLVEQSSTPATPASGKSTVFVKADGLYVVDDAGAVTGPMAVAALVNPMTTAGDIIVGGTSGAPARLAMGAASKVLAVNSGGTALEWVTVGAAPSYPKVATMWADQNIKITGNALSAVNTASANYGYFVLYSSAGADGNVMENGFFIAAGTYSLTFLHNKGADAGKLDITIDGGSVLGTIDFYGAGYNQITTITGIVLTDGYHKLTMTTNGKNAASSSYQIITTKMWLTPAAY